MSQPVAKQGDKVVTMDTTFTCKDPVDFSGGKVVAVGTVFIG